MTTERKKSTEFNPSHIMTGDYAVLMETNDKECESWYYFIRREGNQDALEHLERQFKKVQWTMMDDLSIFDLDLDHYVSAKTAKEMTKLELNSYSFHRKFDGKLKKIYFNFKKKDLRNDECMMCKIFDILGYGQIEDYISDEDIDEEDLETTESSSGYDSSSSEEERKKKRKEIKKGLPPSVMSGSS
jgi:hypothetical protein